MKFVAYRLPYFQKELKKWFYDVRLIHHPKEVMYESGILEYHILLKIRL